MSVDIRPIPRLGWDPLPYDGCVGVVGRVLVREEDFFVAQLRFSEQTTVHEHPGERDPIVVCLEGSGFTSVAGETSPLREGHQVRWPKGITHRLWTEDSTMTPSWSSTPTPSDRLLLGQSLGNSSGQGTGLSSAKRA